jgi:hypothetical protein
MCYQVALGIEHMHIHPRGAVHLDLKESNVLLGGMADLLSGSAPAKALSYSLHGALRATQPLRSCKLVAGGCRLLYKVRHGHAQRWGNVFRPREQYPTHMRRETGTPSAITATSLVLQPEDKAGAYHNPDDESCRTWLALLHECLQQDPELRPWAARLRGVLEQLLERVRDDEEVLPFQTLILLPILLVS